MSPFKKVGGHIFSEGLERIYLFVIEFKFYFVALFFTSRVLECMSYSLDMLIVGRERIGQQQQHNHPYLKSKITNNFRRTKPIDYCGT